MALFSPALIRKLTRRQQAGAGSGLAAMDLAAMDLTAMDDDALLRHVSTMSHLKRFFERYCADPAFRVALPQDPAAALDRYQLKVPVEDVHAFLRANDRNGAALPATTPASEWSPNLRHFRDFVIACQGGLEIIQAAAQSTNVNFRAWREREIARLRFDFSAVSDFVVRPALALELSKGCTVGCWFCAISAEKFAGNFAYTEPNAAEWRRTLEAFTRVLGPAAASGFCYWATDPLDNPDYEKFALDFHDITGAHPPTTTALPLKKPARTRQMLEQSLNHQCRLNRFSILTLPMLDRIHREFSAEELAFVELVLQNPDAWTFTAFPRVEPGAKVNAGRVFEKREIDRKEYKPGTIACITGFLCNMIERTVELVKPCVATQRWPLGYQVLAKARLDKTSIEGSVGIEQQLNRIIERHMPLSPKPALPLRFDAALRYSATSRGFRLSTDAYAVDFDERAVRGMNFQELGRRVSAGTSTPHQIEMEMEQLGHAPALTTAAIDVMYRSGVLAEEDRESEQTFELIPAPDMLTAGSLAR